MTKTDFSEIDKNHLESPYPLISGIHTSMTFVDVPLVVVFIVCECNF